MPYYFYFLENHFENASFYERSLESPICVFLFFSKY